MSLTSTCCHGTIGCPDTGEKHMCDMTRLILPDGDDITDDEVAEMRRGTPAHPAVGIVRLIKRLDRAEAERTEASRLLDDALKLCAKAIERCQEIREEHERSLRHLRGSVSR